MNVTEHNIIMTPINVAHDGNGLLMVEAYAITKKSTFMQRKKEEKLCAKFLTYFPLVNTCWVKQRKTLE